jgi:hypothetical protein
MKIHAFVILLILSPSSQKIIDNESTELDHVLENFKTRIFSLSTDLESNPDLIS